jgi:hypothetical protein
VESIPRLGERFAAGRFNAYKAKRIEDGVASGEADQLVASLRKYAMSNSEFSTLPKWSSGFAQGEPLTWGWAMAGTLSFWRSARLGCYRNRPRLR